MENDRNFDEQNIDPTAQQQQPQPTGQQAEFKEPTGQAEELSQPTDEAGYASQPTDQAGLQEGDTLTEQRSETEIEGSAQQQPTGEDGSGFVGSASESDSSDSLVERDEQ